jgi:hypothetical protein
MEETKYKKHILKYGGETPSVALGSLRVRQKDNVKTDVKEINCDGRRLMKLLY